MPTTATYTLFGQPAGFSTLTADTAAYTMGIQFSVALTGGQTAKLDGVWFYSPPTAGALPASIVLYAVSGASLVVSQAASWSGLAGSGWVFAAFNTPPALTGGVSYKAGIDYRGGANFYGTVSLYWSSGPGSAGVTSGPVTAPNNAGADGGQDTFTTPGPAYPATSFNATNYGIDPQVSVTTPDPVAAASAADQMTTSGGDVYDWVWRKGWLRRAGI